MKIEKKKFFFSGTVNENSTYSMTYFIATGKRVMRTPKAATTSSFNRKFAADFETFKGVLRAKKLLS